MHEELLQRWKHNTHVLAKYGSPLSGQIIGIGCYTDGGGKI